MQNVVQFNWLKEPKMALEVVNLIVYSHLRIVFGVFAVECLDSDGRRETHVVLQTEIELLKDNDEVTGKCTEPSLFQSITNMRKWRSPPLLVTTLKARSEIMRNFRCIWPVT